MGRVYTGPQKNVTSGLQSQQNDQADYLCRRCAKSITRAEAGLFLIELFEWLEDSLDASLLSGEAGWTDDIVNESLISADPCSEVKAGSSDRKDIDCPITVRDGAEPSPLAPQRDADARSSFWYGNYSRIEDDHASYSVPIHPPTSRTPTSRGVLRGDGWYGLVGVEPNPGPPKKGSHVSQRQVHKPIRVVETIKSKGKRSGKRSAGHRVGAAVGGFVGDLAQKAIMSITGMGDYTIHSNSLYNGALEPSGPPQFMTRGGSKVPGMTYIEHREYIGDVISKGGAFTLTEFPITPTSFTTFPWLAHAAQNYEQFKFHGLVFEFKSNSATAIGSTNTALGAVILATQYNSLEPRFVSKLQMDQYQFAVSTNPSISAIHPVECKPQAGAPEFLYLSENGSFAGDLRWNQLGKFSIATVGQQGNSDVNIGELWVSYAVTLCKTRLPNSISSKTFGVYWGRWMTGQDDNLLTFQAVDPWSATATNSRFSGPSTSLIRFMSNGVIHIAPGVVGDFEFEISYMNTSSTPATTVPRTWIVDTGSFSPNVSYSPACYAYGPAATSNYQSSSADAPIVANANGWRRYSWQCAFRIGYSSDTSTLKITMANGTNFGMCNISCTVRPLTWLI